MKNIKVGQTQYVSLLTFHPLCSFLFVRVRVCAYTRRL